MASGTRNGSGRWLLHTGMLLCGIAFTGWYAQHTVLDTSRTERVAKTVLSDSDGPTSSPARSSR